MTIVVGPSQKIKEWVARRIGEDDGPDIATLQNSVGFAVAKDNKPIAGIVFSEYRPMKFGADMRVIIAADDPTWCQRFALKTLFEYAFNKAGCKRLTCVIKEGNYRSEKLCKGLGFRKEGVIRSGWNGKSNAIIYGMLRQDCRWIKD